MNKKTQVGLRLSEEGIRIRSLLAEKLAISKTGVIELALRLMGKHEGINEVED